MSDSQVSRRKFFMHSAHRSIGVSAGLAALQACDLTAFASDDRIERPWRVLLVSGCPLYKSHESLAVLEKHLKHSGDAQCARAFSENKEELPGLEELEHCDCMVLFTRRMKIDGEPLQRIQRYCRRGGAIVGVRTASHGLQNWLEMDKHVFGGDYQGHYSNQTTQVEIVAAAKDHPILAGVEPFTSRGTLYKNPNVAKDATVLLAGTFPGHTHPVAWARPHNGGRVFYTSLGHPEDFRDPNFLRLLGNAVHWTCHGRR